MQDSSSKKLDNLIRKIENKMKKADKEDKGFLFTKLSAEYQKAIRLKAFIERSEKESKDNEPPKINIIKGLSEDLI